MEKGIKCFISYSSHDNNFIQKLVRDIESQGIFVWLDEREILGGNSITSKLSDGLLTYDVFIIILSKNSVKSQWVEEELRVAFQRRIESAGANIIIPVLLEKCKIPSFLKDYKYISFERPDMYKVSVKNLCDSIIFRDNLVKKYKEIYPGNIIIDKAHIHGKISGLNYKKIVFIERYSFVPFDLTHQYYKEVAFDGILKYFKTTFGTLQESKVGLNKVRYDIEFGDNLIIGKKYEIQFNYEILNNFCITNNWYYKIETPTRRLTSVFEFCNSIFPNHFEINLERSLFNIEKNVIIGEKRNYRTKFSFDIFFPILNDTYIFYWSD